MNCADIKKLLSEYMDDELDFKTKQVVSSHIGECKGCASEFKSLCEANQMLAFIKPLNKETTVTKAQFDKLHNYMAMYSGDSIAIQTDTDKINVISAIKKLFIGTAVLAVCFILYQIQPNYISPKVCSGPCLLPPQANQALDQNQNKMFASYCMAPQAKHISHLAKNTNDDLSLYEKNINYNKTLINQNTPINNRYGITPDIAIQFASKAESQPYFASTAKRIKYHSKKDSETADIAKTATMIDNIVRSNEIGGKILDFQDIDTPYITIEIPSDKYEMFISLLTNNGELKSINGYNQHKIPAIYKNKNAVLRINLTQ